ncbi:MAG: AAA family ATPase [Gammaproteobacteria bacterium]|nr:AAA family ATPase [Gammaproteobacteria bacterium]
MYENFYNFTARPFRLSPDHRFYFASRGHGRALSYLKYGVSQGEGFIVITGDIGTGKTTLVNALLKELDQDRVHPIKVTNSVLDDCDLLRMVASSLNIAFEGVSKAGLLKGIEHALNESAQRGRRVLLIIDEAQNLPIVTLEELRMLSNFQTISVPYLQTFLLGQKEFIHTLRKPGLEQLRQRVTASYHLSALASDEIEPYIEHRLKMVGWTGFPEFSADVFEGIFEVTGGIPRRINSLCERLLLFGFVEGIKRFDREVLDKVVDEFKDEVTNPAANNDGWQPTVALMSEASPAQDCIESFKEQLDVIQERLDALEDIIRLGMNELKSGAR